MLRDERHEPEGGRGSVPGQRRLPVFALDGEIQASRRADERNHFANKNEFMHDYPSFLLECAVLCREITAEIISFLRLTLLIQHIRGQKSSQKKSAFLLFLVSNLMNSRIKKFSFLLSVKTWFELIVFPGSLAVLKSCGEAARNFLGKNAFGLIQEYCTIEEIASCGSSPRFARRPTNR